MVTLNIFYLRFGILILLCHLKHFFSLGQQHEELQGRYNSQVQECSNLSKKLDSTQVMQVYTVCFFYLSCKHSSDNHLMHAERLKSH